MPGSGQDDLAALAGGLRPPGGFAVGEERGGGAGGLGEAQQQFQVGQDRHRVLALHDGVGAQRCAQPPHRGDGARPGAGDGADGQA